MINNYFNKIKMNKKNCKYKLNKVDLREILTIKIIYSKFKKI